MAQRSRDYLEALIKAEPQVALDLVKKVNRYMIVPHDGGQRDVDLATERFQIVCAGRRWGKTKIAVRKALRETRKQGKIVWWVAPTFKVARRAYREALKQLPPSLLSRPAPPATADGRLMLQFKNGSVFEFYSADNPESMVGEGVDFVVIDEAAMINERVWNQILRPTLMDTNGGAFLISTPRGNNWFHDLWVRGQDELYPDYKSWHFPTSTNPYVPAKEIAEAEQTLPAIVFEQEILADFVSNAAQVFRVKPETFVEISEPSQHVVMGVDLAKHRDFTVLTGANATTRMPCYHDRFNSVSWPIQKQRILDAVDGMEAEGIGVTLVVDSTGIGDVIYDDLEAAGIDIIPVKFTNQWKQMAVTLLGADLERDAAWLLPEQKMEFENYGYELTEAGRFKFGAPEGKHDDEVSAKMLEHWGIVHSGVPDIRLVGSADRIKEEPEQDGGYEEETVRIPSPYDLMNDPRVWG